MMSSSVKVLNVKLQRADHNVSWGFNIQGGNEFGAPLFIGKVHANSLAEKAGVQTDDYVLRIGSQSTERMTHAQAREVILNQGNYLELTLKRGPPPSSEDYLSRYDFPRHQLMNPENIERVPTASPQVGVQLGGNKALLTQSYNSPMGLYSSKNIANTLVSTLNNMNINDPQLMAAAQRIKPKPGMATQSYSQPPSQPQHYGTQYKPQTGPVVVNQTVSHATITLSKPNSNQSSAATPYGYMQPAMYTTSPPLPQSLGYGQPRPFYTAPPPPPAPKPAYSAPPRYQPPPPTPHQRQINRGNRGTASYNAPQVGNNLPICASCNQLIRGPFISAMGKIWCPGHFVCSSCGINLRDVGFVEEHGKLYCERDYGTYLAPTCNKCHNKITGEVCYALDKTYHPECFICGQCKQKIGSGSFHIEDGVIYCAKDFALMFSVKCAGCEFPIEPLDKFFEALGQKWHTECFICSKCNVPLNGSFVAKGNKPYCKRHAY